MYINIYICNTYIRTRVAKERETYHDAVYHASPRRGGGGRRACVANRFQVPPPPLFGKLFTGVIRTKIQLHFNNDDGSGLNRIFSLELEYHNMI